MSADSTPVRSLPALQWNTAGSEPPDGQDLEGPGQGGRALGHHLHVAGGHVGGLPPRRQLLGRREHVGERAGRRSAPGPASTGNRPRCSASSTVRRSMTVATPRSISRRWSASLSRWRPSARNSRRQPIWRPSAVR